MRVTYYYPWGFFHPVRSGAATVAARHMEYFRSRGMRVRVLLWADDRPRERRAFEHHYPWLEELCVLNFRRYPSIQGLFERYTFLDYLAGYTAIAELAECRSFLQQPTDVAFFNYVFSSPFLDLLPRGAKRVLEAIDIMSTQFQPKRESPALFAQNLRLEFDLYDLFDVALLLNRDEASLAGARSSAPLRYVPQGVETASPDRPLEDAEDDLYDLLFIGCPHPPNIEGVNWFYEHVFRPRLKRHGLRWAIAGSVCESLALADPAVDLLGRVDDLDALYRKSKIVIVPLFQGAGVSIKTLEALGHGKPVVSTPVGMRGLHDSRDCVIELRFEEEPEKVARCIRDLCASSGLRESYGRKAMEYIQTHFSRESYARRMDELLAVLMDASTGSLPFPTEVKPFEAVA
ncbi:MAG TPA: glycosyltransferase [Pirellulales bacterium]|nr:glycosyltransferase [Pirellulales bacterium]